MTEDKPYRLPPPATVADMCATMAWNDDIDDDARLALEMAADTIRALHVANARYANRAEHLEAEVATYVALLYGPQKGGAS